LRQNAYSLPAASPNDIRFREATSSSSRTASPAGNDGFPQGWGSPLMHNSDTPTDYNQPVTPPPAQLAPAPQVTQMFYPATPVVPPAPIQVLRMQQAPFIPPSPFSQITASPGNVFPSYNVVPPAQPINPALYTQQPMQQPQQLQFYPQFQQQQPLPTPGAGSPYAPMNMAVPEPSSPNAAIPMPQPSAASRIQPLDLALAEFNQNIYKNRQQ